ncbi:MAG: pentapeptide repeat-containing protein [Inconstantimicrobium porci]|uniref:pentapeptide repeat-containing protein n=1 Tax=Inconstantimicrobium porci TaxID=2652291 RepID=UPI002A910B1B|nr:pentapeptide repeat-containing protein [Inconstantimicrobium porci]MDY5912609.1 pentapeptide repeat-containing protein [Inconstantimicrobium porci]
MIKKIIKILMVILVTAFIGINTCFAAEKSLNKGNLNEIKLQLEIEKLKLDIKETRWPIIIQCVTAICSTGTVIISVLTMVSSIRSQSKERKSKNIADYISQLSSTEQAVKLSAIKYLGNYKQGIPYLINLLKYEENSFVINTCIRTIVEQASYSIHILINESKLVKLEIIKLTAEMDALGKDITEINELIGIDKNSYSRIKEGLHFKNAKDNFLYKLKIETEISGQDIESIKKDKYKELLKNANSLNCYIKKLTDVISLTIEEASKDKKIKDKKIYDIITDAYIPQIKLKNVDLSMWNFTGANLKEAEFNNCKFEKNKFENSILENASFRECELKNISFQGISCDGCDFSKTDLIGVNFTNIDSKCMSFDGAKLQSCLFTDSKFEDTKMKGTEFNSVKFQNFKNFKCNLMNSVTNKSDFDNVMLNGAIFSGSKLVNNSFNKCKFDGGKFDSATFVKSKFNNMDLRPIQDILQDEDNNTIENCDTCIF